MKRRTWKMWAGYMDGEMDLDLCSSPDGIVIYGAIYPRRYMARKAYMDVRPVEVRELPRKVKK